MKRKLLTSTACLALLMAPMAPAFAQDQAPAAEEPAVILPSDNADTGNAMDNGAADTGSMTNGSMTGQTEEIAPGVEKDGTAMVEADSEIFFVYEADNQYRSTRLVGHTVVNSQDETLGDINDLVISADGKLEGVIIGVGGFLGLGEKDVGVRFDALTITENVEERDMTLTLATTREELEAAPEFVTKEEQAAAEQRKQDMQELGGGTDNGATSAIAPIVPENEPVAPAE